jgi:hypothetical protein
MTTMTRPTARAQRPAAADLRPPVGRPRGDHRPGRSSQVPTPEWGLLACGAAALVGLIQPGLLPWLLIPVVPALLLWEASESVAPRVRRRVIRVFSIAALAAVAVQFAASAPSLRAAAALGAMALYLVAVERVAATN